MAAGHHKDCCFLWYADFFCLGGIGDHKNKFFKKREKLLLQKKEPGKSFIKVRRNLIERMSVFLLSWRGIVFFCYSKLLVKATKTKQNGF